MPLFLSTNSVPTCRESVNVDNHQNDLLSLQYGYLSLAFGLSSRCQSRCPVSAHRFFIWYVFSSSYENDPATHVVWSIMSVICPICQTFAASRCVPYRSQKFLFHQLVCIATGSPTSTACQLMFVHSTRVLFNIMQHVSHPFHLCLLFSVARYSTLLGWWGAACGWITSAVERVTRTGSGHF